MSELEDSALVEAVPEDSESEEDLLESDKLELDESAPESVSSEVLSSVSPVRILRQRLVSVFRSQPSAHLPTDSTYSYPSLQPGGESVAKILVDFSGRSVAARAKKMLSAQGVINLNFFMFSS